MQYKLVKEVAAVSRRYSSYRICNVTATQRAAAFRSSYERVLLPHDGSVHVIKSIWRNRSWSSCTLTVKQKRIPQQSDCHQNREVPTMYRKLNLVIRSSVLESTDEQTWQSEHQHCWAFFREGTKSRSKNVNSGNLLKTKKTVHVNSEHISL